MPTTKAAATSAFMRTMTPSRELAAVVGDSPLSRPDATKRLWDYIKANNLQNPQNKRNILCDAKLQSVMGKSEVTMFEMAGLLSRHLQG